MKTFSILKGLKDCAKCQYSIAYGSKDSPDVKCNSFMDDAKLIFREEGRYCAGRCKHFKNRGNSRSGYIIDNIIEFMLGGESEFILHSTKTNEDYQYKLRKVESHIKDIEYLYYLNIKYADKDEYAGTIYYDSKQQVFKFSQGEKGKINSNDISVKSLVFVLNKLINKEQVQHLEFLHIGKCPVCSKSLESDADIKNGFHKNCFNTVDIPEIIKEF